ncbi:MAG: diphthamide synthesis protein [archaeon]
MKTAKKPLKLLYIEAKTNLDFKLPIKEIKKLPERIFLAYSLQYKSLALSIKSQLEANKIKVEKFQQVLGCSNIKTSLPVLLVSSGKFHAQNLYLQSPNVYYLENRKILKTPTIQIRRLATQRKTALMKFLRADNIGILVSTKPGQNNLDQAIALKNKLEKQGKQAYIFISNNIDINQFENFSIDSWVNTACSGLAIDNTDIINISEIH